MFGGLLLTVIAQIYISVLAFKKNFRDGLLCLLLPGYILAFAMRKETRLTKLLILWGMSIVVFIIGVVLLS